MDNRIKIYISTSDKYHNCLLPFAYLFNKFWGDEQEVIILGYKIPNFKLPNNFSFVSLGEQRGPKYYSEDLRIFFSTLKEEFFIYTMEDQFILDYVNKNLINRFIKLISQEPKMGRICLTNSIYQTIHSGKSFHQYKETDLIKLTDNSNWRITCEWSIWKKDYLIKYLEGNLTPWEFEQQSFSQAKNDGFDIIGSKNKVAIRHAEAIRRGKVNEDFDFSFVNENEELNNNIKKELYNFLKEMK